MRNLSPARKTVSYILKLIVILCAFTGTLLSARAGRNSFMGGNRVFMFFTIQSNIAVALLSAAGIFLLARGKAIPGAWYVVKLAEAVSITLTGVVFAVLLVPVLGRGAWSLRNTLTHAVVPAAAVADFFVVAAGIRIDRKNVPWVILPPLLYAVYAGVGYVRGWEFIKGLNYPYFFLNWGSPAGAFGFTKELPYMGCAWWLALLLAFLVAVGWCYASLAERLGKGRGADESTTAGRKSL